MRFSDKSDILMSTAYGRQTVHFEFYVWNRNDQYNEPSGSLAGYQTILQILVIKVGNFFCFLVNFKISDPKISS